MYFRNVCLSLALIGLASSASAGLIIETDAQNRTIISWTGSCSDCLGTKGDNSFSDPVDVSGNIVVDGFTDGQDFRFNSFNLYSFQYDGPSNHVDNLIIYNAGYSSDDAWIDNSDAIFSDIERTEFLATVTGTVPPEGYYAEFGENLTVSGKITGNLESYFLSISFDTYVPVNPLTGEYIKMSTLVNTGEEALLTLIKFDLEFFDDGTWYIRANDEAYDIGRNAQLSIAQVSEPASFGILMLSAAAFLRLRRSK
ncbi:hypothetical protein BM523_10540 [Alteromonas mediterranea]|uniref:hypothetical protein n=1 Tax=Alteromonas mediterranea TaxID=314275 RepID=UPI0009042606|nr:hypothetical protein [Alteromonas mediterranea]APD94402.1 hypothetical protein BM523_10540 [Alteromonas mediterranea]APD98034.1 hypothetical protein BM525_10580 [Alteromonas mediterranea]